MGVFIYFLCYFYIWACAQMLTLIRGIDVNGLDMTEWLPSQYFGDKIFKKSGNCRQNGQNLAILFSRVGQ